MRFYDCTATVAFTLTLLIFATVPASAGDGETSASAAVQSPVPPAVAEKHDLDTSFYNRCIRVGKMPIVGSDQVKKQAFHQARQIVRGMLGKRPDILKALVEQGVYGIIVADEEKLNDVPEYQHMPDKINKRARGLGPNKPGAPFSGGEENLLGYKGGRYTGESIFLHEFAHAVHFALRREHDQFHKNLKKCYKRAQKKGLWQDHYANTNVAEYWAETVQSYFDSNAEEPSVHNEINTRSELKQYDPAVYKLIDRTFNAPAYRWAKPGHHKKSRYWQDE